MNKIRCALCSRVTLNPAVFISAEPVGPRCARKAGLLALAGRKGSRVQLGRRIGSKPDDTTLDLFGEGA